MRASVPRVRVLLLAVTLGLATAGAAAPHPVADGGGARTVGELAVERLARGGVAVYCGSRSVRLVALTFDDGPGLNAEVGRTRSAETARTGRLVSLFRPPYGVRTAAADTYLRRLGVLQVLWDVADSAAGIRPGSIVLLHETRQQTVPLLRGILRDLKRRHLRAVTVPELLAAKRPRLTRDVRGPRTDC